MRKLRLYIATSHPFMRVDEYRALIGLPLTTARNEFCAFAADPESGIHTRGRGAHRMYVRGSSRK